MGFVVQFISSNKLPKARLFKAQNLRKIHVGVCADSGQGVVGAITSNNVSDEEVFLLCSEGPLSQFPHSGTG